MSLITLNEMTPLATIELYMNYVAPLIQEFNSQTKSIVLSIYALLVVCLVSIFFPFYLGAIELDALEYQDSIYYSNGQPYTGPVELNRSGDRVYLVNQFQKQLVSYLILTGHIEKGKRSGQWTTYLLAGYTPIKIVETYQEGELIQIEHHRVENLNNYAQDESYKRYLIGKLSANTGYWQWLIQKSSNSYYTGQSVTVSEADKMLNFAKYPVFKEETISYVPLSPDLIKYQIFHVLPEFKTSSQELDMSAGPALSVREGKWYYYEADKLIYAKTYRYGQDLKTYNIEQRWDDEGSTCVRTFENKNRAVQASNTETLGFNKNNNLIYVKHLLNGDLLLDIQYYSNGNIQSLTKPLADKKHFVKLQYYPTGELYRETFFTSFSFYDGFGGSPRKRAGPDRFYDRTGKIVVEITAENKGSKLEYSNPNKMNQNTMREISYEGC